MALIDKYADVNLAMVKVILQGLTIDKLREALRFGESLAEVKEEAKYGVTPRGQRLI